MASLRPEAPGTAPDGRDGRRDRTGASHLRRALAIWLVLSIAGIVATVLWMPAILPEAASHDAGFANLTLVVFTAAAVPVALFVWVLLAYSLVVFRVRGRPTADGPPIQASPAIQVAWIGVTAALCLFLVVWGLVGSYQQTLAEGPQGALVVEVTGQQWSWTYHYPQSGASSEELELPAGRPVVFKVTSMDVLHGFDIQELGVRIDANPGQTITTAPVTPTREGSYTVRCVELCGLYHSFMWSQANVVSEGEFNVWLAQHGGRS